MPARITQSHMYNVFLNDLNNVQAKLARTQSQLSSGRRIERISDDPVGAAQTLSFDAQLSDVKQFQQNVSSAQGFVNTSHAALGGALEALQRVRTLTLQAANGTYSNADLDAMAAEVTQLKEVIRDRANTKYGSQYVFSGTATATEPYPSTPPTNVSQGNASALNRRVGPGGLQVSINVAGATVFDNVAGAPAGLDDLFTLLDQVAADMQSGTPAARANLQGQDLQAIDVHFDWMVQQRASLDATASRLNVTAEQLSSLEERLTDARSQVVNVDAAKAYVEFQSNQMMYESALAAGSRIMRTSILDFI